MTGNKGTPITPITDKILINGKKYNPNDVVFKPNPGSQTNFLSCPVYEVLITGTRGSGKTLILLMDYLKDVGVGWGPSWRGIIFRQTYKQLFDVMQKAHEWIPQIFPKAKFNIADNKWVFPEGEQLLFRYMERPGDYWNYHGWEIPWCITPETEVLMGDNAYKAAYDVQVGDYVQTLNGPKLVLNQMVIYSEPCCQLKVVDKYGKIIGVQNQGHDHSVLNTMDELEMSGTWSFGCNLHSLEFLKKFRNRDLPILVYKGAGDGIDSNYLQFLQYLHPYSGKYVESNYFSGSIGRGYAIDLGYRTDMVDLRVEDTSHYITKIASGYHCINKNCGWEELTNFHSPETYESIKSICRSSHKEIPKRYRSTTNPFGPGAGWVKERFVDRAESCQIYTDEDGQSRCWIDSKISENIPFLEADPTYLSRLNSGISDAAKKKAWIEGSWDISIGGIFSDAWDRNVHVLKAFPLPKSWYFDVSYDYGSSKPFSVCFFAECTNNEEVDIGDGVMKSFSPGTLFHIVEYYGYTGKANEGVSMNVVDVTKNIVDHIENHWLLKEHDIRPGAADSSIFTSESRLPSIAMRMLRYKDDNGNIRKGIRWKRSNKTSGSRVIGVELFRTMLESSLKSPMEEPGFFVFDECRNFLRTVPFMPRDEKNPDDVSSVVEDHIWDAIRFRILDKKTITKTQEV